MEPQVHRVAIELNYPGIDKLHKELKRRGRHVTRDFVKNTVRNYSERQLFAKLPYKEGKVYATDINSRWFVDLIDFTAQPSGPYEYILVVQDVFSRKVYAQALVSKMQAFVAKAFIKISEQHGPPREVNTDEGTEFKGQFDKYLESKSIPHVTKDPRDVNALATIDKAIQTIKQGLTRRMLIEKTSKWQPLLQTAVSSYNKSPHSYLQDQAPNEVKDNKNLQFDLKLENAQYMAQNEKNIEDRQSKLYKEGAFRIPEPLTEFSRSFKPKFSGAVQQVTDIDHTHAKDAQGKWQPTKIVLPVSKESSDVAVPAGMVKGSVQRDRVQMQKLLQHKPAMNAFIASEGGRATLAATVNYMKASSIKVLANAEL